jgi:hypothetical protein
MEKPGEKILWLWVPVIWLAVQLLIEIVFSRDVRLVIHSEYGPHELLEFIIITVAAVIACRTLKDMDLQASRPLAFWIGLAAACTLYVSIEEISWGQTFFKWGTPEFWKDINRQHETNLHNNSDWFNQKPRALLEIGVIAGGVLIPLLKRFKPAWLIRRFDLIYPSSLTSVTAGCYAAFKLTDHVARNYLGLHPFARPSEVQELYLYYFVLLYMREMRVKILRLYSKQARRGTGSFWSQLIAENRNPSG